MSINHDTDNRLYFIPLLIVFILLCLSGCASNPAPVTNPSSPSIDNHTTIKLAFGLGCVQLAKRHPSAIPTYLADLTITQSTLDSGAAPYSLIESLAIKSIKSSPEEMIIIQPALDELTSRYFPQSSGLMGNRLVVGGPDGGVVYVSKAAA